ncbi:MAG TPA: cation diffusion facilitator family transporter [Chitinophagaceae bacterium]|nr:cation diffusion facilitator family transporter [Chitinophagaceae bacterium]
MQQNNVKSNVQLQWWIAIASSILLIVKFAAYYITHSVSILTDALESIVNVIAGFIGLYSLYVAAKPKDINHPYGHGKAEFISAAVEGTLVFSAGLIVIYNGIRNLFQAHTISKIDLGIYLVGSTAIINWLLGYISLKRGRKNNSLALIASGKHLQTDTYSTFAIILGLWLIAATGYVWIDAVTAVSFGMFIIYTGYKIVRKSLAGIMDEADMVLLKNMVDVLNKNRRDAWVDLHNLRIIKYGNVLHVDGHLTIPWYFNVNQAHEEIDLLAGIIRKDFGEALELFMHADGCEYFQCPICDKKQCPVRQHPYTKEILWTEANILQNKKHGFEDMEDQVTKVMVED